MIWRISRNGQLKTQCTSITRRPKHYCLVTGKRLQHKLCEETASLQLRHNATNITQISHHKLLGLIVDKDLSFEAHIEEFCAINCQNDLDF